MLTKTRLKLQVFFVALLLVSLSAVRVVAQETKTGGVFTIDDPLSNVELDPFITSWHSWPHYALYSTLFWQDKNLNYVGYLADTWEIAPDSKAITINLIKNAKFSDGTPVNAEAIKWNLDHYVDKDVASPEGANIVDVYDSIEILNDYSFILHMKTPFAPMIHYLYGMEIVSPTAYQKLGKEKFLLNPVGAGPFLLKELNTNNYVEFVRNPDYKWAPGKVYQNTGPVNLDGFKILFNADEQTILSSLETGEIQYAGIPTQNLDEVKANPDITVKSQMATEIRYVGFNTSKKPWDNVDLRRALSYAVNREEVVQLAYNGQATPLYQPLPPTIYGYNPDLDATGYHYDPDKAKAMLDQLGYKDVDGDGIREQPDGSKWVVPMNTVAGDDWKRMAEVVQSQFRDVGVQLEITQMQMVDLRQLTTTGKHDLFLLLYGETDPFILTYFFDPKRLGGSNRAWFTNDKLTELLYKADQDMNPKTRYQTITEASKIIIDQAPWIPLLVPMNLFGVRNELKNWDIDPQNNFLYWNAYIAK
jgi:peptide/nickel transport system substrate-binding protein